MNILLGYSMKILFLHPVNDRDVAQLVAYHVRDVGVVRSSRIIPTK